VVRRAEFGGTARGWILGGVIVALAAAAATLTAMAMAHVSAAPSDERVAPVPTFTQGSPATSTPTPTATPPALYDRAQERFVAVGAEALWRGTAGACEGPAPTLERSTDDGDTWTDVTPTYLGVAQLAGVAGFAGTEAEIIAAMGDACEVQLLRTFTQGKFWAPYPDILAGAAYVDAADPSTVVRAGEAMAAPCDDARGLRGSESAVALVCAGIAYVLDGAEWAPLIPQNVAALALDGDDVVLAHLAPECTGLALTRVAPDGSTTGAGCADVADPAEPAALAVAEDYVVLWSGNDWVNIPR
jgi:hypothetical protein